MLGPVGGDECRDFRNPIGRPAKAGLSGNRIFTFMKQKGRHLFKNVPAPFSVFSIQTFGLTSDPFKSSIKSRLSFFSFCNTLL